MNLYHTVTVKCDHPGCEENETLRGPELGIAGYDAALVWCRTSAADRFRSIDWWIPRTWPSIDLAFCPYHRNTEAS